MTNSHNSFTKRSKKDFTMIQNSVIRNSSLSCKAFKLLCIGLSHSGSWTFIKKQIATCFKEGMHTVDEAMKELRASGHLYLKSAANGNGEFAGHSWFWFEEPISEEEFKLFSGEGGFPGDRKSGNTENPDLGELGGSGPPGDIRIPSSKNTKFSKKNNNRTKEIVVVHSCLEDLNLEKDYLRELSSKLSLSDASLLRQRIDNWKERDNDMKACRTILNRWDTWDDKTSQERKEEKEEANREFLVSCLPWDGKQFGDYICEVSPNTVYFQHPRVNGSKDETYKVEDTHFIKSVNSFIRTNKLLNANT